MASLEEKQAYYTYAASGFVYKQPPALDSGLVEEMNRFGQDDYGDPLWRFLWAGVAVIRTHPGDERPAVRGDRAGTKVSAGRVTPRYLHVRAKSPVWLCYETDAGETARVKREDQVPQGKLTWWEYEYVEFGKLRFYLERKLTPEQLVAVGVYAEDDPDIPAKGDYFCISRGPIETADGLYYEPTFEYVDSIRKHLYEELSETPSHLLLLDRLKEMNATDERERREISDMADVVDDARREARDRPAALKRAPQPALIQTGDVIRV